MNHVQKLNYLTNVICKSKKFMSRKRCFGMPSYSSVVPSNVKMIAFIAFFLMHTANCVFNDVCEPFSFQLSILAR